MNRLALVASCLVMLACCNMPVSDKTSPQNCDWSSYRCDSSNTGSIPSSCSPDDYALQLKWQFAAKGAVIQSPVVAGGKIYVGSVGRMFYCIDALSGKEIWNHEVGGEVTTPAVVVNGNVLFGSRNPDLHCLDAGTGEEKWVYYTNGQISIPSADSDSVYIGTASRELVRLALSDGHKVWSTSTGGAVRGNVAFHGKSMVFGCSDGLIHLADRETGKLYNISKSSGAITTSIVVDGSLLYFASYDGRIHCLDLDTGKDRWNSNIGISQENPPSLWHGLLFFGANDGYFYCLDARSGIVKWTYDTGVMRRIVGACAVSNGMVWFSSEDNYIYCLDAIGGKKLWSYKTGDRIWSSPVISDKMVVVGSNDANVYCFGK